MSSRMESGSLKVLSAGIARYSRERARTIHADANRVTAQMAAARAAVTAVAAGDVPFAGDAVAGLQAADLGAQIHDAPAILVAHSHRHRDGLLRPGIPLVDVHVGAADRRLVDLDEHIVRADLGLRDVVQPDAGGCLFFDQCFHVV